MDRTRALLHSGSLPAPEAVFQAICLDTSQHLDADKTGVWTFDRDLTQIECRCGYDALSETFSSGQILKRSEFPLYFQRIVEDSYVCAPQAHLQVATREFVEPYFKPAGIVSLLDYILHDNARPYGVICCENRRGIRNWSEADQAYLRSIAVLTSFLFIPRSR
jgi:GAF domain-containing protein